MQLLGQNRTGTFVWISMDVYEGDICATPCSKSWCVKWSATIIELICHQMYWTPWLHLLRCAVQTSTSCFASLPLFWSPQSQVNALSLLFRDFLLTCAALWKRTIGPGSGWPCICALADTAMESRGVVTSDEGPRVGCGFWGGRVSPTHQLRFLGSAVGSRRGVGQSSGGGQIIFPHLSTQNSLSDTSTVLIILLLGYSLCWWITFDISWYNV